MVNHNENENDFKNYIIEIGHYIDLDVDIDTNI